MASKETFGPLTIRHINGFELHVWGLGIVEDAFGLSVGEVEEDDT